jgi:hypothetical protein
VSATPDTIWRVPAYLPYVQPPLTEAAVASAEREIGYKLPAEYLNLLKKQNGGYIRYSLPEMVHDSIAGIGPHFPSLTGFDWDECQESVSFPLQGLVPFDGDGHWHICLDYRRQNDAPAITYVDIECDRESPIAASFADYLEQLQIDVEDQYVVEAVTEIEQLKSELSAALGIAFEPPDTFAHGYPTYRGRLGTEKNPQWVWISPNTVPRGFVRPDHARYAELKDLMPGLASRFPKAPADGYILSATDAVRTKVVHACVQSGRVIRLLSEYVRGSS